MEDINLNEVPTGELPFKEEEDQSIVKQDENLTGVDSPALSADGQFGVSHSPTTEIFLGGVPRNIADEELHEILQKYADANQLGTVTSVRLMKDRGTGEPKGYAFATFASRTEALRAAEVLNNMEIKGKHVRVTISENRCRLFVGNIPKDLSREDFLEQLMQQGEGITNLDFLKDPDDATRNRGFAFVEYQDHPSADRARRNLSRPQFHLGKNIVTVNWADPQPEADNELMSQVKVLYIRNLPNEPVSEDQVRDIFARYGEIERVVVPASVAGQKRRDFCFVHYVNKESAHDAVNSQERLQIGGRTLEVTLAKPMDKKQRDENRIRKQARALRRGAGTNPLIPVPMGMPPMVLPPPGRGPGLLSYGMVPTAGAPTPLLPLPVATGTQPAVANTVLPASSSPYTVAPPYPYPQPTAQYAYPYPYAAYPAYATTAYPPAAAYAAPPAYATTPGKFPPTQQQQSAARYHPYQ